MDQQHRDPTSTERLQVVAICLVALGATLMACALAAILWAAAHLPR